ncbi:hypothetical protein NA78x_000358 [Anatilimnocola sp. NA78]|uniref:hypothetical protein n=1 Tax=Anatilimnocola sp. NA78 TaxID=3415683 RepID=UPI003CE53448
MYAAPVWLGFAAWTATAVLFWLAIYEPKRRLSLVSMLVLMLLLAVAFTFGRWKPRGRIEVERGAASGPNSGRPIRMILLVYLSELSGGVQD